jgi:hypothetical protein
MCQTNNNDARLSNETIANYNSYLRKIMTVAMDELCKSNGEKIGGPGHVVEINESRKYGAKEKITKVDKLMIVGC